MGLLDAAQRRLVAEDSGHYQLVLGDEPAAFDADSIVLAPTWLHNATLPKGANWIDPIKL